MIVLDLSLPNELWHTMETLLSQVRCHWTAMKQLFLVVELTVLTNLNATMPIPKPSCNTVDDIWQGQN